MCSIIIIIDKNTLHIYIQKQSHPCTRTYAHTHTQHIHTHKHTNTHTHTHMSSIIHSSHKINIWYFIKRFINHIFLLDFITLNRIYSFVIFKESKRSREREIAGRINILYNLWNIDKFDSGMIFFSYYARMIRSMMVPQKRVKLMKNTWNILLYIIWLTLLSWMLNEVLKK